MTPRNKIPTATPMFFWVLELKDTIANSARCNRKSVFKDGGLQTGGSYNSASRLDSNAVPTANPPFSGSSNPLALLRIVPDVTGSRFFKMAAAKPEVHIFLLPDKIATPFQRLPQIFGILEINGTYVYTVRRNRK
jgi:hypothetical protein